LASTGAAAADAEGPPMWAWGVTTPAPPRTGPAERAPQTPQAKLDNTTLHSVAGSQHQFTSAQISNRFGPADWFPGDHPAMPDIVAKGRASADPPIWACGLCHMPNGKGRPENANLTALPRAYIVRQMHDFKEGRRHSSDTRKTNTNLMIDFALSMTDEEIDAAARYFSSIPSTPWIKVVETDVVPKTIAKGGVYLAATGADAGTEPLGQRIIETPVDTEAFEVTRNPRSGFIAYVPKGSIEKGQALVRKGRGKVQPCTTCHGPQLRGQGIFPPLAGRSPSYAVRQMYDIKSGARNGRNVAPMKLEMAEFTTDDMLAAAAYLASLAP